MQKIHLPIALSELDTESEHHKKDRASLEVKTAP